tara:strand:+ start:156 stop:404 length:249 start_codon:yes stop_codon:yes gene_type:complete
VVIGFCRTQGLNRVYDGEYAITCRMTKKAGFDEEDIRALFEPEGLWLEVLSLDLFRLKQLIADEKTSGDIRKKLEILRRIIS